MTAQKKMPALSITYRHTIAHKSNIPLTLCDGVTSGHDFFVCLSEWTSSQRKEMGTPSSGILPRVQGLSFW